MVDFQSRTTRDRGNEDEEPETGDPEEASGTAEADDPDRTESASEKPADNDTEIGVAVVTVSDTATIEDDPTGDAIIDALEAAGHEIATRELLASNHDGIQQSVDTLVGRDDVDAVVTSGGTGVGARDVTIEAVHPLFEKALPGFGELFRRRYAEEVGTDVVTTRTTAGIADRTPVFCIPGDTGAARVGTSEIVAPQVARLASMTEKEPADATG